MAMSHNIYAEIAPLAKGEGRIFRAGGFGLATIDPSVVEEGAFGFTLAH